MNELIEVKTDEINEQVVQGRMLHKFLKVGKDYTNWIKIVIAFGFTENIDFVLFAEKGEQKFSKPKHNHLVKLDMAKQICMIQRSEKGKQAREYFIEVEKKFKAQQTDSYMIADPVERATKWIEEQKERQVLQKKIEADAPLVAFGNIVNNSTGAINIGTFAKLLYDKDGIKMGRNKLMEWLRDNGYLMSYGRDKNTPKQVYVEQGLFKVSTTVISCSSGQVQSNTSLITGKGQIRFTSELKAEIEVNKKVGVVG